MHVCTGGSNKAYRSLPCRGARFHSNVYLFIYKFIGSSGVGLSPRLQEEEHEKNRQEPRKSEVDPQRPGRKESGTGQGRKAGQQLGWRRQLTVPRGHCSRSSEGWWARGAAQVQVWILVT